MVSDQLPGTFFGPSTLIELLRYRMQVQPDDMAYTYLVDGESEKVSITYRELDRQARAIAAWLVGHGLTGERALLLYPAGLEFIGAFFGCLYAGVIAVPVYPPRRNRSMFRIQAIADDAQAKVALTTEAVLQRVEPIIDDTPHLKDLTWLPTCNVPPGTEDRWQEPQVDVNTLAFLQYTSGSTGTPKGVVLTHGNLVHNAALIGYSFELTRSGVGVFWLPSYHDMGLIGGILEPLYIGQPNILMSPMSFLQKPYRWLSAISRYGATTSGGPNFAYDLCVRKITPEQRKTLDLSRWLVAFNGAEPIRAETLDAFTEAFAPCGFRRAAFYPCFGLAEATLIVSGGYTKHPPIIRHVDAHALAANQVIDVDPEEEGARALVGCGQNLRDQEIVIVDPDSLITRPADCVGEIWVRGPSVAQGYWRQPEATEVTFRAYLKDTGEGPFLRTGDLGFVHDGELFVTGRLKDLIIIHGVNYYPQDIEQTITASHPRLRIDAGGVFSVEIDGVQHLVAVQEVERRHQGNFDQVFNAMRRAVSAEHDVPLDAILLLKAGSIPKTSSGKIQRHACRRGYLDGTLEIVAQWRASESERGASAMAKAAIRFPGSTQAKQPAANRRPVAEQGAAAAETPSSTGNNGGTAAKLARSTLPATTQSVAEIVVEQVRAIAKDRAKNLTLDTVIAEMGLDSLERMEIIASLEERFGGRFPEDILPVMETSRQVIEAVEKYLGTQPRPKAAAEADAEIPPENYTFALFPEFLRHRKNIDLLQSSGLGNPFFTVHQGITNDHTTIDGRVYVNFSSYNYIGTSGDPVVMQAAKAAIDRYGTSVSASRLVSGEKVVHGELERAIAGFLGTEAAVTFVGGHATNETTLGHLLGPGDLALHDALAHNSIVQGCILSGARRRPFPHNDWRAADALLEQYRHEYRRVMIVIEGVYSMDGDIPNLPRFIEVKRRRHAMLMIDEAHSAGTLGPHGRGIGEYYPVDRRDVDVWMGTLSKSFGSCGGYIAGCRELVEYLKYTAPGFVFAAGMPPAAAAAALASIRLLEAEPERVIRLQRRAKLFLDLARQSGLNTGMSKDSPVVPVILGNSIHCLRLSKALFARGINVQPILHPAVEESAARLRFFITSLHTEAQIRDTVAATVEELEKINPAYLGHKPEDSALVL